MDIRLLALVDRISGSIQNMPQNDAFCYMEAHYVICSAQHEPGLGAGPGTQLL